MMSWMQLTELLRDGLGDPKAERADDAAWVAQRYSCEFGPRRLFERICEAVPDGDVEPGEAHDALRFINWEYVLTLNYDTLLERAFARNGRTVVSIVREEQLARMISPESLPIVHLHGSINDQETIVLTLEHFRQYPAKRPIFMNVARQLLLQHPVLFVGFGASDPNFVAWSGWIRDALGEQTPPWLRLEIEGRTALAGFDAYWRPRLQTVPYPKDKMADVLNCLGKATRPVEDFLEYSREVLGGVEPFERIVAEVERSLREQRVGPPDFYTLVRRREIVSKLLERGLKERSTTDEEIEQICGSSSEFVDATTSADDVAGLQDDKAGGRKRLTLAEQRKAVVEKLGPSFIPWLAAGIRLLGRYVPVGSFTNRIDALEAVATTRSNGFTTNDFRALAIASLPYRLDQLGERGNKEAALEWLGVKEEAELSNEDRPALAEVLEHHSFRWRGVVAAQANADDAQSLRRAGFVAVMEGRHAAAATSYERAFRASRDEGESAIEQYLTARSAQAALARRALLIDEDPTLDDRRSALREALRALEAASLSERLQLNEAMLEHESQRRKDLLAARDELAIDAPARDGFRSRTEPLENVLLYYEGRWLSPQLCEPLAERLGESRWDEGELVAGARLLATYGCEQLSKRIATLVDAPRLGPLNPELVAELLRDPHWEHERAARDGALAEALRELPIDSIEALRNRAFVGTRRLVGRPVRLRGWTARPSEHSVSLAMELAKLSSWTTFLPWWRELVAARPGERDAIQEGRWLELPFLWWLRDSTMRAAEFDEFATFLFDASAAPRSPFAKTGVLDMLVGAWEELQPPVLRNAKCCLAELREFVGVGAPRDDQDEWLRTACAAMLAEIEGLEPRTTLLERANHLRGLTATSVSPRNWNPFVIHAWILAVERSNVFDFDLAWRILRALPDPAADDNPFVSKRLIDSRVAGAALRLVARIVPSNEAERGEIDAIVERAVASAPTTIHFLAERFESLPSSTKSRVSMLVTAMFLGSAPHGERTRNQRAALRCLQDASDASGAGDVPPEWIFAASTLTTAISSDAAGAACHVLRAVASMMNRTGVASGEALIALRGGLLRATCDGRAYVVGVARRTLLTIRESATLATLRAELVEHPDVRAALHRLESDRRTGVVVAGEPWVREPLSPRAAGTSTNVSPRDGTGAIAETGLFAADQR